MRRNNKFGLIFFYTFIENVSLKALIIYGKAYKIIVQ